MLSTEPNSGLNATTLGSWPEQKSRVPCSIDWTTQVPQIFTILFESHQISPLQIHGCCCLGFWGLCFYFFPLVIWTSLGVFDHLPSTNVMRSLELCPECPFTEILKPPIDHAKGRNIIIIKTLKKNRIHWIHLTSLHNRAAVPSRVSCPQWMFVEIDWLNRWAIYITNC